GYPGMAGYPGFNAGYPGVGFNLGINGGFNGGISGYPGYPGGMYTSPSVMSPWMNPQYQAMQQASLQAQMQAAARSQQSNQNLMIAQQQAMEAMSRYQSTAYGYGMGNYGYS